jgi:hypothetical protein
MVRSYLHFIFELFKDVLSNASVRGMGLEVGDNADFGTVVRRGIKVYFEVLPGHMPGRNEVNRYKSTRQYSLAV